MKKLTLLVLALSFMLTQAIAHVNLLNPSGNETYMVGETITLEWQIAISHNVQNWDLSVSIDDGVSWEVVELDIPQTGSAVGTIVSYDWVIPNTPSEQVKLWIVMDNVGVDYSDTSPSFTISSPLSIAEQWSETEIDVFPNPVPNGEPLWISFPESGSDITLIEIFDSKGAFVKSIQIRDGNLTEVKKVDLEGMRSGLYFMILSSNESAIQRRSFVVL